MSIDTNVTMRHDHLRSADILHRDDFTVSRQTMLAGRIAVVGTSVRIERQERAGRADR
ncbi:hypothetical protein ABZ656_33060 [Streptomyces sp. NPDC007095]|jgi:hypothetical protein|uniref:hypothetical protein n=1 Tax=Streptomyces sp. NPDC007095 TaxID=3154482 RepID=UPI000CAA3349